MDCGPWLHTCLSSNKSKLPSPLRWNGRGVPSRSRCAVILTFFFFFWLKQQISQHEIYLAYLNEWVFSGICSAVGNVLFKNMNGAVYQVSQRKPGNSLWSASGAVLFLSISASGSMDMVKFQRPRLLQAEYVTSPLVPTGSLMVSCCLWGGCQTGLGLN